MLTTTGRYAIAERLQERFLADLGFYGVDEPAVHSAFDRWQRAVVRAGGEPQAWDRDAWAEVARRRREHQPNGLERWIRRTREGRA